MNMYSVPEPDTKDWTWVLQRPCPDCGFAADTFARGGFTDRMTASAQFWRRRLAEPGVAERPSPGVWSPLEYGCHVRDVFTVFAGRYTQMLESDGQQFANWDQDKAAVQGRYADQHPGSVVESIAANAASVVGLLRGVDGHQWDRTGLRSDGSAFTVDSLVRYHLHDLVHHEWDVSGPRRR